MKCLSQLSYVWGNVNTDCLFSISNLFFRCDNGLEFCCFFFSSNVKSEISHPGFYRHFGLAHFLSRGLFSALLRLHEQQPSPPPTRCQPQCLNKDSKKHLQILSSVSWRDSCSLLRNTVVETLTQVFVVEMIL